VQLSGQSRFFVDIKREFDSIGPGNHFARQESSPGSPAIRTDVQLEFWRVDFSPRGALAPLFASEAEACLSLMWRLKPALRDVVRLRRPLGHECTFMFGCTTIKE
jgi:hypothetical protein